MKKINSINSLEIESDMSRRVSLYLDELKATGLRVKLDDVCEQCNISRHTAREFVSIYTEKILDSLMLQSINSLAEFYSWCKVIESFRSQLERKLRYQELRIKQIQHAIFYLNLSKELTVLNLVKIVGGDPKQCRARIFEWEQLTGLQSNSRRNWKHKLKQWDPSDRTETKAVLYQYLEKCLAEGNVISLDKLVQFSKRSRPTVSAAIKPYLDDVAHQLNLEKIVGVKDIAAWNSKFNVFKYFFLNITRYKFLREKRLRLAIESVKKEFGYVSYTEVIKNTGSATALVNNAIRKWELETGETAVKIKAWKKVTLDMLIAIIPTELQNIPLSFLDKDTNRKSLSERHLRAIYFIPQPHLRSTAFFVLSFADSNRANDITFFTNVSKILLEEKIPDIYDVRADDFFNSYFSGTIMPNDSQAKRVTTLQSYFRLIKREDEYFRLLTLEQCDTFSKYRLPKVIDTYFWTHSNPYSSVRNEAKNRRKQKTDVVHDKFYILRNISERRCIQIERLTQAYNDIRSRHEEGKIKLPYAFSISDETISDSGSIFEVTHNMVLWDTTSLVAAHTERNPEYYKNATPAQEAVFSNGNLYFISYDGGSTSQSIALNYWFMQAGKNSQAVTRRIPDLFKRLAGKYDWDLAARSWHYYLLRDLSLRFLPIETLKRASLIGNAAIQIMTKTGARMNEFLQIRLTPEKLCRVNLGDNKEAIAFWATPKGRTEDEPYYIDEKCMQALHSWWSYCRGKRAFFDVVPPTRALDVKLMPANYLWQVDKKHLSHSDINGCIRFLWSDVLFVTSEGDSFDITSHLLRHSFATELRALDTPLDVIGMLMKQRDISVTDYYSKPPPAILADMQRKIFASRIDLSKSHTRTVGEMRRQVDESKQKIGALIPIVGGNCTVANECPAKYACIGCAANVPDPKKRIQVVELKLAYETVAEFSRKNGLPAEIRKAEQVISSCNDLMMEMDIIEATEKFASSPVTVKQRTHE